MKNENFVVIHGWMVSKLNLSGVEKEIYAIIYGFSQDGQSRFTGSVDYLQEWTGAGRSTVFRHLKSLEEKGLIVKHSNMVKGFSISSYSCNLEAIQNGTTSPKSGQGVSNRDSTSPKSGPYNIDTKRKKEKYSSSAQDAQTTTDGSSSSSLFDEQIYDISVVPEFVINFIEAACRRRGMPEDDIPAFLMSLEENCNHVKIDRYRRSPGLVKLIDKSMANNFATHGSCPGSR